MIISLGDLTLDILVQPDKHGVSRRPNSPGSVKMTSGGAAPNFAVWISRLGHNSRFIGKIGVDPAADLLVLDLLKEGVLPETVVEEGSTATLVHMLQKNQAASRIPDRGVAVNLKPEEIEPAWFQGATWLHLPASSLLAMPIATAAARAVRLARSQGAALSIELSPAAELKKYGVTKFIVMLKALQPTVIFTSQDEAMLFSQGALGDLAEMAVLRFEDGSCALSDVKGYTEFEGAKGRLVDADGCIEAFDAAWCASYLDTGDARAACRAGQFLAAKVAAQPGVRPTVDLSDLKRPG